MKLTLIKPQIFYELSLRLYRRHHLPSDTWVRYQHACTVDLDISWSPLHLGGMHSNNISLMQSIWGAHMRKLQATGAVELHFVERRQVAPRTHFLSWLFRSITRRWYTLPPRTPLSTSPHQLDCLSGSVWFSCTTLVVSSAPQPPALETRAPRIDYADCQHPSISASRHLAILASCCVFHVNTCNLSFNATCHAPSPPENSPSNGMESSLAMGHWVFQRCGGST